MTLDFPSEVRYKYGSRKLRSHDGKSRRPGQKNGRGFQLPPPEKGGCPMRIKYRPHSPPRATGLRRQEDYSFLLPVAFGVLTLAHSQKNYETNPILRLHNALFRPKPNYSRTLAQEDNNAPIRPSSPPCVNGVVSSAPTGRSENSQDYAYPKNPAGTVDSLFTASSYV